MSGKDWTLTGVESLALDPTDPARVYIAAGSYNNDWSGNGAILRSADRGVTWTRVESFTTPVDAVFRRDWPVGMVAVVFRPLAREERSAGVPSADIWLAVSSPSAPLWRSSDAGLTWSPVSGQPLGLRCIRRSSIRTVFSTSLTETRPGPTT